MKASDIAQQVSEGFADRYEHFKEFQRNPTYRAYWDLCLDAIADRDFLLCVVFCNDVFEIPPIKTFLTYHRDRLIVLTGDEKAKLDLFVKRSMGAVWAMAFKFVLGYSEQKSVSVSMSEYFQVKTASMYSGKPGPIEIE